MLDRLAIRSPIIQAPMAGVQGSALELFWAGDPFSQPGIAAPLELARIYRARQQVFTIEQDCVYLDADEADADDRDLWLEAIK